jgi:hypothetical protein
MKKVNVFYQSKVKVTIKLNTKMDDFHQSAINVGEDDWVVIERNTREGGVDITLLDKYTPITQELARFEDGKFDFSSYKSQVTFINLFRKHPKLKRELLKVSYPLSRYMGLDLDIQRFKRSIKYSWLKFKRSITTNFSF